MCTDLALKWDNVHILYALIYQVNFNVPIFKEKIITMNVKYFQHGKISIKKISFYIIMVAIVVSFPILLGEVYLRITGFSSAYLKMGSRIYPDKGLAGEGHYTYDPLTGYALIPNIIDKSQGITTDENGFRITAHKINFNKKSIIFVGDSTVFGWCVADKDTFVFRLSGREKLQKYNVINMGVPSYSLGHISAVLTKKVPLYNPKIVFVQILWPWKPFEAYSSPTAWKEIDFAFYKDRIGINKTFEDKTAKPKLRIWSFLKNLYFKLVYAKQIKENLTRPGIRDFNITTEKEEWLAREHVNELKRVTKSLTDRGVKVIFYVHPYQYVIFHEDYKNLGVIGKTILLNELPALYPTEFLIDYKKDLLFVDGSHLSEAGHRVFEIYFYDILNRLL